MLNKIDFFVGTCECFNDCFFHLGGSLNEEDDKFFMVIWDIWHQRNEQLWKGEHIPSKKAVLFALDYLFDWLHARQCQDLSSLTLIVDNSVLQRPPTGML